MTAPAVTIALSAKDNAAFLPQAMDTLLAQTFGDFELIAVDDGSSDATWEILQGCAARDPRVRPLRNETNIGLAASLNRILAEARAPLIARADGDDVYHPERLARQVAFMAANPKIGVLSCGFRRVDAEGRVLETVAAVTGPARLRLHLLFANPILHPGAMIRTPLLRAHGGYAADWRLSQDLELWARLSPHTRLDNIAAPLVDWRRHGAASMATRDADAWSRAGALHRALLEAYLGAPVEDGAAACAALLFWGRKALSLDEARAGDAVLRAVARRAALREPPGAQLFLRARAAVALARSAAAAEPSAARALRLMALRWRPGPTAIRAVLTDLLRRAPAAA